MADQLAMDTKNRPLRFVGVQGTPPSWSDEIESSVFVRICPDCHGTRLKPEALSVTVDGRTIAQVTQLSIAQAQRFFQELTFDAGAQSEYLNMQPLIDNEKEKPELLVEVRLSEREGLIARKLLKEISA